MNITGALCLAENSVSDRSVLPSAIIKSYKGLTVEIKNTDAEGRLVLADGMSYVQKHYKYVNSVVFPETHPTNLCLGQVF